MLGLDGLRGVAILAVIGFHEQLFSYGWVGVDLFFVLSGFLITGILLRAIPAAVVRGKWHYFYTFYVRRSLRIFPIYYFYLISAFVVFHGWASKAPMGFGWYIFYSQNFKPGYGQFDGGYGHLWSLAIEEQFYLVWPAVVLFLGHKRLTWVCWFLIVGALSLRAWMCFGLHFNLEGVHRLPFCRIDTFAVGAMVSLYLSRHKAMIAKQQRWVWAASVIFILAGGYLLGTPLRNTLDWSFLAIGFGLLIAVVAATHVPLFEFAPLRKIGELSYSMYLFHQLVFTKTVRILGAFHAPHLLDLPTALALTVGLAMLTGRYIEGPFLRLKDRFLYREPAVRRAALVGAGALRHSAD